MAERDSASSRQALQPRRRHSGECSCGGVIVLPLPASGAVPAGVAILLATAAAATIVRRDIT